MERENGYSWNPIWEDVYRNNEWGKYPGESLIQFIARNFYNKKRDEIKLLEVGCGTGPNVWYMSREGFDVTGIDGSKTAIEKGISRLKNENLNASLIEGDIINLPFQNDSFDGAIDVECLYCNNTSTTERIMQEIKRILKPGGFFYSRTFTSDMYIGKHPTKIAKFEFSDITEGPQAGRGFMRLIDKDEINHLYGKFFEIISIDKLEYTRNNSTMLISEWIIICKKNE